MEATLQCNQRLLRFVNIYRAPYSKKHRFTISDFHAEFEHYLQILKSKNGTPILAGDFNIHLENSSDINCQRFCALLDNFSLSQKVPHIPTHIGGGTLDLLITDMESELDVSEPSVIKLGTTSDHFMYKQ